jgi:hypothetical protein
MRHDLSLNIDRINVQDLEVEDCKRSSEALDLRVTDLKERFSEMVVSSEENLQASQLLSVQTKTECNDMLMDFKRRVDDVDRVKAEVSVLKDKVDHKLDEFAADIQQMNQSLTEHVSRIDSLITTLDQTVVEGFQTCNNDIQFLKEGFGKTEEELCNVTFYINKVQPIHQLQMLAHLVNQTITDKEQLVGIANYQV